MPSLKPSLYLSTWFRKITSPLPAGFSLYTAHCLMFLAAWSSRVKRKHGQKVLPLPLLIITLIIHSCSSRFFSHVIPFIPTTSVIVRHLLVSSRLSSTLCTCWSTGYEVLFGTVMSWVSASLSEPFSLC